MKSSKIFLTSVLLLLTLVVTAQAAWTPAPANPPDNNAPEPINVTATSQKKDGGLTLGGKLVVKNIEAPDCIPGGGIFGGFKCLFGNVVNIGTGDLTSGNDSLIVDNFLVAKAVLATKILGASESFQYATSTAGFHKILASTDSSGSADWVELKTIWNECVQNGDCVTNTTSVDSNWEVNDVGQLVNKNPNGNVGIKANLGIAGRFSVSETSSLGKGAEIIGANSLEFGTVLPGTKATDAGKIRYNNTAPRSLDIFGGGLSGSRRLVNVYDDLNVHGDISICTTGGVCTQIDNSSSIDDGTSIGQGIYWNNSKWVPNNAVRSDGTNVGVGFLPLPGIKLAVSGKFGLIDGTQGNNKILVSSATGTASWKNPSEVPGISPFHDADTNKNWIISAGERDVVLAFYNAGGAYKCDPAIASGYSAGAGSKACKPHSADSDGNWVIDLGELNRVIQFVNVGGYAVCNYTEDGFRPINGPCEDSSNVGTVLPNGGSFGETLYWDTSTWKASKNLINDETRFSVAVNNLIMPGQAMFTHNYDTTGEVGTIRASSTAPALDITGVDAGVFNRVNINDVLTVVNKIFTPNLEISGGLTLKNNGAGAGKVLTSDAAGNASWVATSTLGVGGGLPTGAPNATLRSNGSAWLVDSTNLTNNGTNVSIGASPDAAAKLLVQGKFKLVDGTQANGYILQTDATGLAKWVATSTLGLAAGTDSNWTRTGTNLSPKNTGDNVGVGTNAPASLLTVLKNVVGGRGGEISIVNGANPTVNAGTGEGNEAALNFGLEPSTYNGNAGNSQIKSVLTNVNGSADLVFSGWNGVAGSGGSFSEYMRIKAGGFVGIGTKAPKARLDVNGKLIVGSQSGFSGANLEVTGQALIRGNGARLFLASSESTNPDPTQTPVWNLDNYTGGGLDKGFRIYRQASMGTNQAQWPTEAFMIEGVNGNVGIGRVPTQTGAKLDIGGQVAIRGGAPGLNKVLVSDTNGLATWQNVTSLPGVGGLPGGQADQTLRYDNGAWVGTDSIKIADSGVVSISKPTIHADNLQVNATGSFLALGNATVMGNLGVGVVGQSKLDINGQIRIRGGSPGLNKILVSDANGLATWQNASVIIPSVTDNDKQTLSFSNNTLAVSGGNSIPLYSAGTGLVISGNTLSTQNTQALWNANQLQGRSVVATVPNNGQVLKWNGSAWAPANETPNGLPINSGNNKTLRYNSTSAKWEASDVLAVSTGTDLTLGRVAIGPNASTLVMNNSKGILNVNGTTETISLKIPTTNGSGKVLTSDADGDASWKAPILTAYFDQVYVNPKSGSNPNGISYSVAEDNNWLSWGARDFAVLTCPSGTTPIAGGAVCNAGNELSANGPVGNNSRQWRVSCGTDLNRIQRISVSCAYAE